MGLSIQELIFEWRERKEATMEIRREIIEPARAAPSTLTHNSDQPHASFTRRATE
jgi:hypothetical protein